MEIEGERVSSSQNERTLRGEGVLENEQGPTGEWGGAGGRQNSGILDRTYFLNVLFYRFLA